MVIKSRLCPSHQNILTIFLSRVFSREQLMVQSPHVLRVVLWQEGRAIVQMHTTSSGLQKKACDDARLGCYFLCRIVSMAVVAILWFALDRCCSLKLL